jgi:hypothetical protein
MFDPEALLRVGATIFVQSGHPDCLDDYQFRLTAAGARELVCVLPGLEQDRFRAVFTAKALAAADGLLAVHQTNPYPPKADDPDGKGPRMRRYTYRATTPPFLLSKRLGALVRDRKPIALHFYDFLDDGRSNTLAFASEERVTLKVDGRPRKIDVVRYRGDYLEGFILDIAAGTRFVLQISRSDDNFYMRTTGVRTRPRAR